MESHERVIAELTEEYEAKLAEEALKMEQLRQDKEQLEKEAAEVSSTLASVGCCQAPLLVPTYAGNTVICTHNECMFQADILVVQQYSSTYSGAAGAGTMTTQLIQSNVCCKMT